MRVWHIIGITSHEYDMHIDRNKKIKIRGI